MLKEKLLEMLLEHKDSFISGEKISKQLGCSRTAVWKHIEELRKNGYKVEAIPRKGYHLVERPNTISPYDIKVRLQTKKIGQRLTYHKSVASTQEIAHRLSQEGTEEGHVVLADEQKKGKGRLGREWHSPFGTSVSMSIILRPKIPPQQAPQLTLIAAVAVVKGIYRVSGLQCQIKWPNDILINGKKIVGILTEMQTGPDVVQSVIVGIGINVNHQKEQLPAELKKIATSLAIEKGEEINRAALISAIFEELEQLYEQFLKEGFAKIKPIWEEYAITLGKKIKARTISGTRVGMAKGITDEGVLLLEDDNGDLYHIYSADIEM